MSLPESQYSVTCYKAETSPQLRAKHITEKYDPHVPMTVSEFVARAWKLANDKARELGKPSDRAGVPLMRCGPLGRAPPK